MRKEMCKQINLFEMKGKQRKLKVERRKQKLLRFNELERQPFKISRGITDFYPV